MRAEERILRAFREAKLTARYFSQVKEATGLSHSSLQNALAQLEQEGIVSKEATNAHVFYRPAARQQTFLRLAGIDTKEFEELHRNARIPLQEFLEVAPKEVAFILLFGSAARKEESEESDIDLLVVLHAFKERKLQEAYEKEMVARCEAAKRRAEALSLHRISLAYTTIGRFIEDEDHLIEQARSTGFPILHPAAYHEVMRR